MAQVQRRLTGPRSRILRVVIASALWGAAAVHAAGPGAELKGVVRVAARPQPNAVVWLDAPSAIPRPPRPTERVVLDQRNLQFSPRVLAVRVGTIVEMPNSDRVFHNVFSFHDGKRFDLGLYPVGTVKRVTFDHAGLSRIFCNIHPNMASYVIAVDTPYFAVSDEQGRIAMPSPPSGSYTYHAWRAGARELIGSVAVGAIDSLDIHWP